MGRIVYHILAVHAVCTRALSRSNIISTLMKFLFLFVRMIISLTFFRRSPEELAKEESEGGENNVFRRDLEEQEEG